MILLSIPSPPDNTIGVGPLELRAYGLMIAIGDAGAGRGAPAAVIEEVG